MLSSHCANQSGGHSRAEWEDAGRIPPKMIGCPGVAAFVFQPNAISAAFAQTKENSEWREGGREKGNEEEERGNQSKDH